MNEAPPVTMYSYAGPVIELPFVFFAIGSVIVVLKFALLEPADLSQPLHTTVNPRCIRNRLASAVGFVMAEPGSSLFLPASTTTRPRFAHVLPPRFGGSYIILWAPLLRSTGFSM